MRSCLDLLIFLTLNLSTFSVPILATSAGEQVREKLESCDLEEVLSGFESLAKLQSTEMRGVIDLAYNKLDARAFHECSEGQQVTERQLTTFSRITASINELQRFLADVKTDRLRNGSTSDFAGPLWQEILQEAQEADEGFLAMLSVEHSAPQSLTYDLNLVPPGQKPFCSKGLFIRTGFRAHNGGLLLMVGPRNPLLEIRPEFFWADPGDSKFFQLGPFNNMHISSENHLRDNYFFGPSMMLPYMAVSDFGKLRMKLQNGQLSGEFMDHSLGKFTALTSDELKSFNVKLEAEGIQLERFPDVKIPTVVLKVPGEDFYYVVFRSSRGAGQWEHYGLISGPKNNLKVEIILSTRPVSSLMYPYEIQSTRGTLLVNFNRDDIPGVWTSAETSGTALPLELIEDFSWIPAKLKLEDFGNGPELFGHPHYPNPCSLVLDPYTGNLLGN